MTIPEQIALAAISYFGKAFVFCRLINKNVLEWFLLMMCTGKLLRHAQIFGRAHLPCKNEKTIKSTNLQLNR